jgi:HEAT repeat protein
MTKTNVSVDPKITLVRKVEGLLSNDPSNALGLALLEALPKLSAATAGKLLTRLNGELSGIKPRGDVASPESEKVNQLIGSLRDICQSRHKSEEAVKALVTIGSAAVKPLIVALRLELMAGNSHEDAASLMIRTLGEIKDPGAAQPLIEALGHEAEEIGSEAAKALASIGPGAVDSLIRALTNKSVMARLGAVEVLDAIGDSRSLVPLIATALKDDCPDVREAARAVLFQARDPRAVEPLTEALTHDDRAVRRRAVEVLGSIEAPRAMRSLIRALKDSDINENAVRALTNIGAPAVAPLIEALKDKYPIVREQAAKALGWIGDQRSVDPLSHALSDTVWYVRSEASKALETIGDPKAIKPIREQLQREQETRVRDRLTDALTALGRSTRSAD